MKAGIPPEMVRLSVGIEDPADLIADLEQALTLATTRSWAVKDYLTLGMLRK